MRCSTFRKPVSADIKPGLVLHYPNCVVSYLIISDVQTGEVIDWATGKNTAVYPAIAYVHEMAGAEAGGQSSLCAALSTIFHVAEVQKLESEA